MRILISLITALLFMTPGGVSGQVGAARVDQYLHLLNNKKVACVVNQTSVVDDVHLIDFLLSKNVNVVKILAPEHGFRGEASAGAEIKDGKDEKTGIAVASLYGKTKKPTPEMLKGVDVILFDIQDVGARFYTYISTMHYVMEACAEENISLIVLDRPNPNGHYVDGPVLKEKFRSFVGMHAIPVVHGCTVGELASMINGEGWLENGATCDLTVVPVAGYHHADTIQIPIAPSPNLPNDRSINLYPSLCFFEGTVMSIGRGTPFPFQVIGFPDTQFGSFYFTPVSMPGKSEHPKHENQVCYGTDLRMGERLNRLDLSYVIKYYQQYKGQEPFFIAFFNTLAGTDELMKQIEAGLSEEEIRLSWLEELNDYKAIRRKYLLYPDFE